MAWTGGDILQQSGWWGTEWGGSRGVWGWRDALGCGHIAGHTRVGTYTEGTS